MTEIVPCNICGVIPKLQKSHSSRLISHRCRDYHSRWGSRLSVISDWNNSNSQKIKKDSPPTSTSINSAKCPWHDMGDLCHFNKSKCCFEEACEVVPKYDMSYIEKYFVSFGNYLLSDERNKNIAHKANQKRVTHADIQNFKDFLKQKAF